MDVKEKDHKYFGRGSKPLDLEVARAVGSLIFDPNDKKYIDFLGASGVCNLGWGKKELQDVISNYNGPSYVYPHFYYKPWTELAELLAKITPGNLTKSFRMTGGSEAVEAAMEMAMMCTGRKKFLSVEGSYHGNTIGAISIGATSSQEKFPNLLPNCEKIAAPLNSESLEKIEEKLQKKEFAAIIMEPIICNLGVLIPETGFMENLDKIGKQYGTLLIMDEAISGFGRTGKFFASEHFEINPDIMCLDKAMAGGHAGIGGVITTPEIAEKVEGKIGLYSTFGWHPLSTAVAVANINYMLQYKKELFENIENIGRLFKNELQEIDFRNKPEIRIKGLAIGVDVKDKEYASAIKEKSLKEGLTMNSEGSTLVFFPALNIDEKTVKEGLSILQNCVQ